MTKKEKFITQSIEKFGDKFDYSKVTDINNKEIDKDFHIISKDKELYSFVRLEDINYLKDSCELNRVKIIAQDGPTEYIKKIINKMNDDELELFFKYHLATCEREELLGASRHILDILRK